MKPKIKAGGNGGSSPLGQLTLPRLLAQVSHFEKMTRIRARIKLGESSERLSIPGPLPQLKSFPAVQSKGGRGDRH